VSLIQEALKRQQEEQQAPPDTPPPPPPPRQSRRLNLKSEPEPEPEPSEDKKRSRWLPLFGVIAVMTLLLGTLAALVYFSARHLFRKKAHPAETNKVANVGVDTPPTTNAVAQPPATNTVARPPRQVDPIPPDRVREVPPHSSRTNATAVSVRPDPTNKPAVTDVPKPPFHIPKPPSHPPKAADWPILVLEGIVGKGTAGAARLNGQIVFVGDLIEGVRVIGIQTNPNGAELEYQGERLFLRVGSSTQ